LTDKSCCAIPITFPIGASWGYGVTTPFTKTRNHYTSINMQRCGLLPHYLIHNSISGHDSCCHGYIYFSHEFMLVIWHQSWMYLFITLLEN